MKILKPEERLIVAADFKPTDSKHGRVWVENQVQSLAKSLNGTGVYIKVNSALRAVGYDLIQLIHSYGLKVFADLKLHDIPETLATDGGFLREVKPELLTVVCTSGLAAMQSLKESLPETEILGVTVLTSLTNPEVGQIYRTDIGSTVCGLALLAKDAGMDGIICSPKEAQNMRINIGEQMTINTPAIRPTWAIVSGDDQNPDRIMTPEKAIMASADRIVVGRPIIKAPNPYDAVMRTLEEIVKTMAKVRQ